MILYHLAIFTAGLIVATPPADRVSKFDRELINQLATTLIKYYNRPRVHDPKIEGESIPLRRKLSITFIKPELWGYTEAQVKNVKTTKGHNSYWRYWLVNIHEIKKLKARISGTEKLQERYRSENPFCSDIYENEARELLEEEISRLEEEIKSLKLQAKKIIDDLHNHLYSFTPVTDSETRLTNDLKANWINLSLFSYPKPAISNDHAPSKERRIISIEEERNSATLDYKRLIESGADAVFIMDEESFYIDGSINDLQVIKTERIKIHKSHLNTKRLGTRVETVCDIMKEALHIVNQELDPKRQSFFDIALDTIREGLFWKENRPSNHTS